VGCPPHYCTLAVVGEWGMVEAEPPPNHPARLSKVRLCSGLTGAPPAQRWRGGCARIRFGGPGLILLPEMAKKEQRAVVLAGRPCGEVALMPRRHSNLLYAECRREYHAPASFCPCWLRQGDGSGWFVEVIPAQFGDPLATPHPHRAATEPLPPGTDRRGATPLWCKELRFGKGLP
jgi:hypothetical protein